MDRFKYFYFCIEFCIFKNSSSFFCILLKVELFESFIDFIRDKN